MSLSPSVTGVYDITVAFRTPTNPHLSSLLLGHTCMAEAFIRRIPVSQIPYENDAQCAQFIQTLFQEKVLIRSCRTQKIYSGLLSQDKTFEYFAQHGTFEGAGNPRATSLTRKKQDLIIELICLLLFGLPSIYFFIKFILCGSLFTQMIFVFVVMAGKPRIAAHGQQFLIPFLLQLHSAFVQ